MDAPWAADVRPYLTRAAATAPLLVQLNFPLAHEHNSGVFYARATAEVRRFFEMVVSTCSSPARRADLGAHGSDQRCSNFVLQCAILKQASCLAQAAPRQAVQQAAAASREASGGGAIATLACSGQRSGDGGSMPRVWRRTG